MTLRGTRGATPTLRLLRLTGLAVAVALALAGCGGHGVRTDKVVATFRAGLVRQAGPDIKVSNVTCLHGSGSRYRCQATFTAGGQSATVSFAVICDKGTCSWRRTGVRG